MPPTTDTEALERFLRRMAGIEADVKDAPELRQSGLRPSARFVRRSRIAVSRLLIVPALVAIVVVGVGIGLILLTGPTSTATPPAAGASIGPVRSRPDGPARLRVGMVLERRPLPSGITLAPGLDNSKYLARLSTIEGREIMTWNIDEMSAAESGDLAAGPYRVSVWRVTVTDNVDTGVRATSQPMEECSTEVTLAPATTTSLIATYALGAESCTFSASVSLIAASAMPTLPQAGVALSVEIERQTVCASEGGCAVFIIVQSAPGSPDIVDENWRLQNGPDPGSFHLPPGARTTLPVGQYRVTAHVNWVSDVIPNGQSPTVGAQESSCGRDLTVRASDVAVRIQVAFDKDPCEMTFTASPS